MYIHMYTYSWPVNGASHQIVQATRLETTTSDDQERAV